MNAETALPPDYPTQPNPPPRPSPLDDAIRLKAVHSIASDVAEWLDEEAEDNDELIELLTATMPRSSHIDGFKWALKLQDKYHFDGDSRLVEILEGVGLWSAHRDAVMRWVNANGIKAAFAIGNRVLTEDHGPGTITSIYPLTAEYVIRTEDRQWTEEQSGYLIPFEKCSEIANG